MIRSYGVDVFVNRIGDECEDITIRRPGLYIFGTTSMTSFPAALENEVPMQITCGCEHSVILTESGRIFVAGDNTHGQLGLGNDITVTQELMPLETLSTCNVVGVCCGDASTLFLTSDGEVLACGENACGQLGMGHLSNVFVPTKVPDLPPIKKIAASGYFTVLLSRDGDVWVSGDNFFGQLGLGHMEQKSSFVQVPELPERVESIACSGGHTALLTTSRELLMVGSNSDGQLGSGGWPTSVSTYQPLKFVSPVTSVACGSTHTVVLTEDGTVSGWGYNTLGRLGVGFAATCSTPTQMRNLRGHSVSELIAGNFNSAVITTEGELLVCGRGLKGGLGGGRELLVPHLWPKLPSLTIKMVAFAMYYVLIYAAPVQDSSCLQT